MLTWSEIKSLAISKNIPLQFKEEPTKYLITLVDGSHTVTCEVLKNGEDEIEFETSFKALSNRRIAITTTALPNPESYRFRGDATPWMTCAPGVTNLDLVLTEERFVDGGIVVTKDANPGDYCTFQIVHPVDGVVEQFVNRWVVAPGTGQMHVNVYPARVPAGLTIRIVYNNVGATNAGCAVNLRLHKAGSL